MVLETGLIIAAASTATEAIIITKIPAVRTFLVNSSLGSLAGSTVLSWLIGFLFEATGLTVLIGALISTLLSWLMYRGMAIVKIIIEKNKLILTAS